MKYICLLSLFFLMITTGSFAQSQMKSFKADSNGGKQERLEALEKYMAQVSSSINAINLKLSKTSGKDFRKLERRVDKIERADKGDNTCCVQVKKHNLPKMEDDIKSAKKKIKDLELKANKIQTDDLVKMEAEVRVLKAALDNLEKVVLQKLKNKQQ